MVGLFALLVCDTLVTLAVAVGSTYPFLLPALLGRSLVHTT